MRQSDPLMTGSPRRLPTLIQGATPLFGATLVAEPKRLLDEVYGFGVDAFDSGLVYADEGGTCDGRLGDWVADRGLRESVTLIGKGCHPGPPDWTASRVSPELVAEDIAVTLDRMGTDRLDLWLFHRDNSAIPVGELVDAAQRQVASGAIDAWGVSNWSTERFLEARDAASTSPPAVTSPQFSLVDQIAKPWPGISTITGPAHVEDRAQLADAEISVITWSPLAGGFLTMARESEPVHDSETSRCYDSSENRARRERCRQLASARNCSPEQLAITYVVTAPFRTHVVCAARGGLEVAANLEAVAMKLTGEERKWLEDGDY